MLTICVLSLGILLAGWVIYPLWMYVAGRNWRAPNAQAGQFPTVDVVIATRDSPDVLRRRVENLLASAYPAERLRIIIAVDVSAREAMPAITDAVAGMATVVLGDAPGGKAAALNAAVRVASADILVFADSHQRFDAESIPLLVAFLGDRTFGGVSGSVRQESGDALMDMYWRYELLIRRGQTAIHSIVSTSGQIQAVWRELWRPLPAGLICDDLFTTLQLVRDGHRVGYCDAARAIDPRRFTRAQHYQRKVRTLTGLVQYCAWEPAALVPWRNPIWLHFVLHKLVRMATPYLAILLVVAVLGQLLTLVPLAVAGSALAAVAATAVVMTIVRRDIMRTVVGHATWAVMLLTVPVVALRNGLRRDWAVWHYHAPQPEVQ